MSLNKVLLMGNLGADPELRYSQAQLPICTMRIATNDRRKNADGQWVDNTEWHTVVCFGKSAENCNQYLSKGSTVFVDGRIQTRKYQDKDGKDKYWTEIIASTVQFMSKKGDTSGMTVDKGADSMPPMGGPQASGATAGTPQAANVSFDDDDIPF